MEDLLAALAVARGGGLNGKCILDRKETRVTRQDIVSSIAQR
jgi:hypothetical protein